MTEAPSRSVRLFGTDQSVTPPRVLKAGPLTVELEAGNLRYIRFSGLEMIRAISFIVRDKNWGTYEPAISDLVVEESGDRFRVAYSAIAKEPLRASPMRRRSGARPMARCASRRRDARSPIFLPTALVSWCFIQPASPERPPQ
jgi:D-apionolactonase